MYLGSRDISRYSYRGWEVLAAQPHILLRSSIARIYFDLKSGLFLIFNDEFKCFEATVSAQDEYAVGWITALDCERAAAEAMLDEEHDKPHDFTKPSTDYNSLLMGSHRSPQYCNRLPPSRHVWADSGCRGRQGHGLVFPHIRAGLMVGIGGGIPQPENEIDIRLGDIVVSEPSGRNGGVAQYDAGKATKAGFELKGFLAAPPAALLNAVTKLKARHRRKEPRVPYFVQEYARQKHPDGKGVARQP